MYTERERERGEKKDSDTNREVLYITACLLQIHYGIK